MDNILNTIYRTSLKFLTPLTLEQTYEVIIKEALRLVKADFGSIFLYEDDEFKRVYTNNPALYDIKVRKKGFTYRVFKERRPIILDYAKTKKNPHLGQYAKYGILYRNDLMVPLFYQGKSLGVLSMISARNKPFTQTDVEVLTLLVPSATLAIRKAQLYDQTQKALEARDSFISMAAHELRTPLTTINGYSQLLHTKLSKSNTPEARWIEELSWECRRLTLLVNELLEVERIKTGQLRYLWKECSLGDILKRALQDFNFTHPQYKVVVEDKVEKNKDKVIGDYDKLLQVIINLLDNAAKFSAPDKKITVSLKSKSACVILSVKDQGKGITKKDLPGVFDRFYRGTNQNTEGMGIGLFLAKSIINQHNGTINIKSKEGKGTTIEIKLPRAKI